MTLWFTWLRRRGALLLVNQLDVRGIDEAVVVHVRPVVCAQVHRSALLYRQSKIVSVSAFVIDLVAIAANDSDRAIGKVGEGAADGSGGRVADDREAGSGGERAIAEIARRELRTAVDDDSGSQYLIRREAVTIQRKPIDSVGKEGKGLADNE